MAQKSKVSVIESTEPDRPSFRLRGDYKDRALLEDHLAKTERHVQEGEKYIARQIALIAKLERRGHDKTMATRLLEQFQEAMTLHIQGRDRLQAELDGQDQAKITRASFGLPGRRSEA